MLRGTPFHSRTAPLCQSQDWRRWAGFLVAGSYELHHLHEYHAIRTACALIDVSPLFKYRIRGVDAERLCERLVTRSVRSLAVGRVAYTPWCDEAGKVRDDGTLQRLAEKDFRLTAAEPNLRWLRMNGAGLDVEISDESEAIAALAIQGPLSRDVLGRAAQADTKRLRFFGLCEGAIAGCPVTITRTGYTGDLGYEIWLRAEDAETVWDALIACGEDYGITPAGLIALDLSRVEAGLILIDVDYFPAHRAVIESRKSTPYELGLGWTVSLDGADFLGRQALVAESARGSEWNLRGIAVDWDALEALFHGFGLPPELPGEAWRRSVPVYAGGQQVGYATSGCWSPVLKRNVALAHLRAPWTATETPVELEVTVEHQRHRVAAAVVDTPFFDPERKRA